MKVKIELILETDEHTDSTKDAIKSTQNQIRAMDLEELIDIMDFEVLNQ